MPQLVQRWREFVGGEFVGGGAVASGCAVVTIDWRSDFGRGRFIGLVEDEPNACSAT